MGESVIPVSQTWKWFWDLTQDLQRRLPPAISTKQLTIFSSQACVSVGPR